MVNYMHRGKVGRVMVNYMHRGKGGRVMVNYTCTEVREEELW